jgi:hypothetical protein
MRIKSTDFYQGKSEKFSRIYILTSISNDLNFVVLLPNESFDDKIMHDTVKDALKNLTDQEELVDQNLWLPQFKIGDKTDGHMKLIDPIKNYKVEE